MISQMPSDGFGAACGPPPAVRGASSDTAGWSGEGLWLSRGVPGRPSGAQEASKFVPEGAAGRPEGVQRLSWHP